MMCILFYPDYVLKKVFLRLPNLFCCFSQLKKITQAVFLSTSLPSFPPFPVFLLSSISSFPALLHFKFSCCHPFQVFLLPSIPSFLLSCNPSFPSVLHSKFSFGPPVPFILMLFIISCPAVMYSPVSCCPPVQVFLLSSSLSYSAVLQAKNVQLGFKGTVPQNISPPKSGRIGCIDL